MINIVLIVVSAVLCVLFFGFFLTGKKNIKKIGIAALFSVVLLLVSYTYTNYMTKNLPVKTENGEAVEIHGIIFKNEEDLKNRVHPVAVIDEDGNRRVILNSSLVKVEFVSGDLTPGNPTMVIQYISVTANEFHSLFLLTKKIPNVIYIYNCADENLFCTVE